MAGGRPVYFACADATTLLDAVSARCAPGTTLLVLAAGMDALALADGLKARQLRGFGGVFPALIVDGSLRTSGALVRELAADTRVAVWDDGGWRAPPIPPAAGDRVAAWVLFDWRGAPSRGLDALFDRVANRASWFGAGAGTAELGAAPVVFTQDGAIPGGLVVGLEPGRTRHTAHGHGWRRLPRTLVATRTVGNTIFELNWGPAGARYRAEVEALDPSMRGRPIFPDFSESYPLGVRLGGADVIRDPMRIGPLGELVFLADIPENSVVHLEAGEPEALLRATAAVVEGLPERISEPLVAVCFTRQGALRDRFSEELALLDAGLRRRGASLEGVLAFGEVASDGEERIELYNKTVVVSFSDVR